MSERAVLSTIKNRVATITLNRPERLNAITDEMLGELKTMFGLAQNDAAVRVIILTGAGRGFCAGQDVSSFAAGPSLHDVEQHLLGYYKPLIELMRTIEKPIIGAINGVAAGAGASLALACDLRIMARDATLIQAFSNIGPPDQPGFWYAWWATAGPLNGR